MCFFFLHVWLCPLVRSLLPQIIQIVKLRQDAKEKGQKQQALDR